MPTCCKAALNARRRQAGQPEIDAFDFLALVQAAHAGHADRRELPVARRQRGLLRRREEAQRDPADAGAANRSWRCSTRPIRASTSTRCKVVAARRQLAALARSAAILLITHYQRLLDYIVPDQVHVLARGRLLKSGDKSLALELEQARLRLAARRSPGLIPWRTRNTAGWSPWRRPTLTAAAALGALRCAGTADGADEHWSHAHLRSLASVRHLAPVDRRRRRDGRPRAVARAAARAAARRAAAGAGGWPPAGRHCPTRRRSPPSDIDARRPAARSSPTATCALARSPCCCRPRRCACSRLRGSPAAIRRSCICTRGQPGSVYPRLSLQLAGDRAS